VTDLLAGDSDGSQEGIKSSPVLGVLLFGPPGCGKTALVQVRVRVRVGIGSSRNYSVTNPNPKPYPQP
jgi:GTPase SAR1 family protein